MEDSHGSGGMGDNVLQNTVFGLSNAAFSEFRMFLTQSGILPSDLWPCLPPGLFWLLSQWTKTQMLFLLQTKIRIRV